MPDYRFAPGRFDATGRWWAGCVLVIPGPPEPDREPDSEDTAGHVADALRYAKAQRYYVGVDWGREDPHA